ncbi:MAG: hypothetical protein JST22_12070 [Bacteroidetes bacterium]|nr:hypothetical protein [Bacteroidota bacterium]
MRFNPVRFLLGAIIPAALAAFATSCNDNPTTIGAGYLSQNVTLRAYTLTPDDYYIMSGVSAATNGSGETGLGMLIGHTAEGATAHGLLALTSQSPTISGTGSFPVKSASLQLHTMSYHLVTGDTATRDFAFDVVVLDEVFSLNAKWTADFATRIANAPSLGTFTGTYTDNQAISVTLDPTATQKFLQEYFRYDSTSTGPEFRTLKTLALRAKSDGRIIAGLNGVNAVDDSLRPKLSVVAADGTPDDTTVTLSLGTSSWIADAKMDYGVGKVAIASGLPVRTLIQFRLGKIPATATIHSAEFRLTVDTAHSIVGSLGIPSYLVGYLAVDSSMRPSYYLESGITGVFPVNRVTSTDAGGASIFTNTFRFTTLAPIINSWLRNSRGVPGYTNDGIILAFNRTVTSQANLETATLDRLVFYGLDEPDSTKRPNITIYYSLQTDAN